MPPQVAPVLSRVGQLVQTAQDACVLAWIPAKSQAKSAHCRWRSTFDASRYRPARPNSKCHEVFCLISWFLFETRFSRKTSSLSDWPQPLASLGKLRLSTLNAQQDHSTTDTRDPNLIYICCLSISIFYVTQSLRFRGSSQHRA